ncbi:MAG: hypothetical protein KGN77_02065 [Xanthomonadaceae bacterium]|nr:hypothetical protein [Xanthomonadaceae bacterium]
MTDAPGAGRAGIMDVSSPTRPAGSDSGRVFCRDPRTGTVTIWMPWRGRNAALDRWQIRGPFGYTAGVATPDGPRNVVGARLARPPVEPPPERGDGVVLAVERSQIVYLDKCGRSISYIARRLGLSTHTVARVLGLPL